MRCTRPGSSSARRRSSATPRSRTCTLPIAHPHDRWGFRLDEVEYDPSYHRILAAAVARGAHTSAWADPKPGADVARAAMFMLFAQVEPGHACPVSMTHAAVASIRDSPWVADDWLPRLYSRDYEPRLLPNEEKTSALIGMAMTEKQGGSDVRAGTTVGTYMGGHAYQITGHKWFCSAPMSDGFLVLAQTRRGNVDEGLSCLFVPRLLPRGMRNVFRIQHLKDKLGNRSNASASVEFDGTIGLIVGEPGRGVRAIIEMVQRTRLDSVLGTAAGMRQSVAEAVWHARGRAAFGKLLVDQPAMTAVLADLALESEAAMLTGLRLAQAFEAAASDRDVALRRLATPVSKYWVTKRGPHHAYEALECLGRQRLHRVVPARPSLPRAAGDGDLGGVGQRDRARRAACAHPRPGLARRPSPTNSTRPRENRRCSTPTSPARSHC